MTDGCVKYPSVFVVDGGTGFPPPLPPKPGQTRIRNQRNRLIQNILLVLVCLALFGLFVEGIFIYSLHAKANHNDTAQSNSLEPKTDALKGGRDKEHVKKKPKQQTSLHPSKPLAHLAAGDTKPQKDGIMKWRDVQNSTYELEYNDGKLIVQKDGFYYVYSKLSYTADGTSFIQMVQWSTSRYLNKPITLLRYSRRNSKPVQKDTLRSSYLGGIFHLYKGDAVYVEVKDGSAIRLHDAAENAFGMFML
ncbi:hypothetical protein AMELA_G00245820 [Ameiurus melas]|uniref:THD domain-containing protein n=1 Tax=Ameiurus melas TaxID=219545 RepID=A0A7J5ZVG9_AMEME|nr:hypothetical protein AMELA_G00245820 [Ameiurus melas]